MIAITHGIGPASRPSGSSAPIGGADPEHAGLHASGRRGGLRKRAGRIEQLAPVEPQHLAPGRCWR